MAKNSGISWADHSFGFWYGCHKVSQGCKFCYAERQMDRSPTLPDFRVVTRAKRDFKAPLGFDPGRVFVCPWSDFFHIAADEWRDEAWDVIRQGTFHNWIILTKRPENVLDRLPADWGRGWPHVWLGVSVESQPAVDARLPLLMNIPAQTRIVSVEPLLGPVFLLDYYEGLQWVIVGGESGPHQAKPETARPMPMATARVIRDSCVKRGIAFYFKQDAGVSQGERPYIVEHDGTQTEWFQYPPDLRPAPAEQMELL